MSLINFESSWKKAAERENVRKARETILAVAEAKAEKETSRKKAENSWMLPGLDDQIQSESHQKSKKSKKVKKEKKRKRGRSKSGSSTPEEKDSTKQRIPEEKKRQDREDWMNFNSFLNDRTVQSKDLIREKDKKKAAKEEEQRIRSEKWMSRELNPNLRAPRDSDEPKSAKPVIGDGGASWLRRAFKRAEEQAQREGKTIEEVAAVRWGSLENFKALLNKAEGRSDGNVDSRNSQSTRADESRGRRSRSRDSGRKERSRSRDRDRRKRERSRSQDRERSRGERSDHRHRQRSGSRDHSRSPRRIKDRHRPSEQERNRLNFSKPDLDHSEPIKASHFSRSNAGIGNWKTGERLASEKEKAYKAKEKSPSESEQSEVESHQEVRVEEKPIIKVLSEQELNTLGAKLVKAEILGNTELAGRLKAQLEEARAAREEQLKSGTDKVVEEVVVLTRTDARGMTRPVDASASGQKETKRKKKAVETHANRERQKYFADDDKYDLKTMFQREKLSTAEDQNGMLSRLAGRGMETTNDEYDMDDVMVSRAAKRGQDSEEAEKDRSKAIYEHKKLSKVLDDCKFCFGTKHHQKHLMIALGRTCYLSLPEHTSLSEGHCFIIPISHATCAIQLDEDVYSEMQQFRTALTKMFLNDDSDCVFFESAMGLKYHPHMVLECVPLPKEAGDMAPMFFQKAIQECESEWSHNKKLISLRDKPLRKSVPKGLPYFHVDFGTQNGFAHVIEDEKEFPRNFAQEIIGGILDLEPRVWRNPKRENFDNQRRKVLEFGSKWREVDFTKKNNQRDASSSDSDSD